MSHLEPPSTRTLVTSTVVVVVVVIVVMFKVMHAGDELVVTL